MKVSSIALAAATAIALAALSGTAAAQVTINQTKAMAGNVTPGDAPGFPVEIKQAGHYRLTSDLVVPQHQSGIVIQAANVTLDLNGYTIRSINGCTVDPATLLLNCPGPTSQSEASGVVSPSASTVIRNGRIHGFPGHGIRAAGGEVLEDLSVYFNRRYGLVTPPSGLPVRETRIRSSRFYSNGNMGAMVRSAMVESSQFSNNGSRGLSTGGGTVIDSLFVRNDLQANSGLMTTIKGTTILPKPGSTPIKGLSNVQSLGGNFDGSAPF